MLQNEILFLLCLMYEVLYKGDKRRNYGAPYLDLRSSKIQITQLYINWRTP